MVTESTGVEAYPLGSVVEYGKNHSSVVTALGYPPTWRKSGLKYKETSMVLPAETMKLDEALDALGRASAADSIPALKVSSETGKAGVWGPTVALGWIGDA